MSRYTVLLGCFVLALACAAPTIAVISDQQHHGRNVLEEFASGRLLLESSVQLTSNVTNFTNGQWASVTWTGVSNPNNTDFVAVYVGANVNVTLQSFANYVWANSSANYTSGSGSAVFYLLNQRQPLQFAYLRGGTTKPTVAALSQPLYPVNINEPTQGHLSLTGTPTQMQIQWTTKDVGTPQVRYGTASGQLTSSAMATSTTYNKTELCGGNVQLTGWLDPGTFHTAIMTNLPPATRIYYQYGDNVFGYSSEKSFLSSPATGPDSTVKVIISADIGQQPRDGTNEPILAELGSLGVTTGITKEVLQNGYQLVLQNGDIAYADGYLSLWEVYQEQIEAAATAAPWMTTDGNHERDWPGTNDLFGGTSTDSRGECGVVYSTRFQMPVAEQVSDVNPTWYSYDFGPIHFLTFSTEVDFMPDSPQYEFITADLAAVNRTKTPWLIVSGHRPIYVDSSSNSTTDNTSDGYVGYQQREALEELFYEYNVDLLFAGHIHLYQKSCPIFAGRCLGFASDGTANGPIYAITGNGGRALSTSVLNTQPYFTAVNFIDWGYGRLTANRTSLTFEMVLTSSPKNGNAGKIVDSFTLTAPATRTLRSAAALSATN